jgi:hypothetical protein
MAFSCWSRGAVLLGAVGLVVVSAGLPAPSVEKKPGNRTTGPWNLRALLRPPKVSVVEEDKTLTTLYYQGEPYQGTPTRVFAYLARPDRVDGKTCIEKATGSR